jgi:arylsulfatase A-like enzyme
MNLRPLLFALSLGCSLAVAADSAPAKPFNVLFIISDDLRAEIGCYGGQAITPHLDRLAASGVKFERGYVQYPLCCPSRTSMLTGHRPAQTGIYGNRAWFGDTHPDWKSLPRWFKDHGYVTARAGKIFHDGIDDTDAWTQGGEARFLAGEGSEDNAARKAAQRARKQAAAASTEPASPAEQATPAPAKEAWSVLPGNGETDHDYRVVDRTIEQLRSLKDQPFFIACGLSKPHTPLGAPQKFFDLYDLAKIPLPVNFAPRPTVPEGFPKAAIRPRNADLFIGHDATPETAREVIRAYLASCSYVDDNVGRVLAELDRLGLAERTIVVFWGDHGYQLGERGKWSKAGSLFEQGARSPFIIRRPGAAGNGKSCPRVVEALDFYATLTALCGLPAPAIEGRNLAPLLENPQAEWNHPGFTVWSEDGKTIHGATVRNERWRYAEFFDGSAMLFDEDADPQELKNVADAPENAAVRAELSQLVKTYLATGPAGAP